MNADIERRLHRIEAMESIRSCVYSYAAAGDRKNDPVVVRSLFTADGSYSIPGMFDLQGRDAIVAGLVDVARDIVRWAFHHPGGPLIQLAPDGLSAKAFWWVWIPVEIVGDQGAEPRFDAGHYSADLVESDDGWKFRRLLFEPKFTAQIEGPWQAHKGDFQWPF